MATIDDYLFLAESAYSDCYDDTMPLVSGFRVKASKKSKWYGDGFHGVAFASPSEVIIAFSGTKMNPIGPSNQHSANLLIALKVIPFMAGTAYAFARDNMSVVKMVSLVGHSLGGALAQVVGAWLGVPFINFGGPGMAAALKLSKASKLGTKASRRSRNAGNPVGINFVINGDHIGSYGEHVGLLVAGNSAQGHNHSLEALRSSFGRRVDLMPSHWEPAFADAQELVPAFTSPFRHNIINTDDIDFDAWDFD